MYEDLSDQQIGITRLTYDSKASQYAHDIEWSSTVMSAVKKYLIIPFIKHTSELGKNCSVGIVGCGTGRDARILTELGYVCTGYDISVGMLKEAKKRVVGVEFIELDISSSSSSPALYDAVYCESALGFIKKDECRTALDNIYKMLRPGGKALLGFKNGTTSLKHDALLGSERYYLSYSFEDAKELITSAGFFIDNFLSAEDTLKRFKSYINFFVTKPPK